MCVCVCVVGRVFASGPVDLCSIPGFVIPKTLKIVLDTAWLNTRQYKCTYQGLSVVIQGKK